MVVTINLNVYVVYKWIVNNLLLHLKCWQNFAYFMANMIIVWVLMSCVVYLRTEVDLFSEWGVAWTVNGPTAYRVFRTMWCISDCWLCWQIWVSEFSRLTDQSSAITQPGQPELSSNAQIDWTAEQQPGILRLLSFSTHHLLSSNTTEMYVNMMLEKKFGIEKWCKKSIWFFQ